MGFSLRDIKKWGLLKRGAATAADVGAIPASMTGLQAVIDGGSPGEKAALSSSVSRYCPPPGARHVSALLWGDSLSAQCGGASPDPTRALAPTQYSYGSAGYFTWVNIALGQPFYPIYNCGVGSQTTTDMLARIDSELAGKYFDYCFSEFGINNFIVRGDTTPDATIADTILLWQKLRPKCGVLYHMPIWPNDSVSTAQRAAMVLVNNWIVLNHRAYGVTLATALVNALVDPAAAAQWSIRDDATADNTHPHSLGAQIAGAAYATELAHLATKSRLSPLAITNLLTNGELRGTAGSAPTGWTAFGTVTTPWSYPARPDGQPGTIATVGTSDTTTLRQTLFSGFVVGGVYIAEAEYTCSDPTAKINLQCVSGTVTADAIKPLAPDLSTWATPASGVLRTPEFVIPAGASNLQFYLLANKGGTYGFGRAVLRRIS